MKSNKVLYSIIYFLLIVVAAQSFAMVSSAAGDYSWKVVEVTDGDTLKVYVPEFPKELANKVHIRVLGIDTPEKGKRAKCEKEAKLGIAATAFTKELVKNGNKITFHDLKWDKYGGRILATVKIDNKILGQELIKAQLAREYHGEKKQSWCK